MPRLVAADRWLVLLRVIVGGWFLKAVWTKISLAYVADVVPYPAASPRFVGVHARRVTEFAAGNPLGWYREFLEGIVLPNAPLFALLQTWAEVVVGVGLVLGLFTVPAAALGLLLSVAFGLATQWMSPGQQGFHLLLTAAMLTLLGSRAGRRWGVDAVLRARAGRSPIIRALT